MERLYERLKSTEKALSTFYELVIITEPTTVERDAAIQRFEYSFEACWKTAKQYLYDVEGIDIGSPKGVIRSSREVGIFSERETILGLNMVDHRNLTVHTYNEELALEIFASLPQYYQLLRKWVERIRIKIV
ncbi:HI0074 family nucleotidyltransferase substrate-binding subunit [Oceanobacillus profundus]|uniref:HI0074 family nucleotidyltransferase substrate-binding subunit n=1 Tax=Oceanobacillus TaxID=182709 RepID=UPI0026E160F3|nr:HI0074 family nucleotidyltransferase substrate-binding subunit [Oceanobacillus profundus]MDO6449130.1 HI0074 family nucleotidyltransferase substrate-binding subunit [Oceanobacillus profundus]